MPNIKLMEPIKTLTRTKTMSLIISALTRLSIDCENRHRSVF